MNNPKKRPAVSVIPPAIPKPADDARPDPETFLNSLPGRQEAPQAEKAANPQPTPKKPAKARKRPLADSLAEVERPPLPTDEPPELLQRLAVDIPAELHATIKRVANRPGGSVRNDVAALLEWYYRGR